MFIHTLHFIIMCMYISCLVPPYSVVVMGDNLYSQGDRLQLNCSSEGVPELKYTWTFSGSTIINASSNILTIDNITTSNGGNYTCNVTNNVGSDATTITIHSKSLAVIVVTWPVKMDQVGTNYI